MVMVYDGDTGKSGGLQYLTIVGYGIIQVDGYQNGGNVPPPFKNSGNTVYGHVIKHRRVLPQQGAPYIIQPSALNKTPGCADFVGTIFPELEQKFPVAKLVGSNDSVMHYGMAKH